MDLLIIISGCIPAIGVICSLPVVFRMVSQKRTIQAMLNMMIIGMVMACSVWVYVSWHLPMQSLEYLSNSLFVIGIYTGCVLLFLLAIFSVFEASLTLWFLSHIATHTDGLSKTQLLKQYGISQIIQKRLDRFVSSGDITRISKKYVLSNKQSYFRLRELYLAWFWKVFP